MNYQLSEKTVAMGTEADFDNRESQRVSLERLPTNTTTDGHPFHRWYNFIAGYSPEFVKLCLEGCGDDTVVLDPFAGMVLASC